MEILASCSYEESLKFDGKLVIDGEDGSKPDKVSLNVIVENGDLSLINKLKPCVKCITYKGNVDFTGIAEDCKNVFYEMPLSEVVDKEGSFKDSIVYPNGVTTLVRLPDDYSNMKLVKSLCNSYPTVRVIGGNLLNIEGVHIGRYEVGKDKGSPVYNGVYDQFLEIPLSEIGNLKEVVKKARKKLDSTETEKKSKGSKVAKEKKAVSKKNEMAKSFSSLFSTIEEEEF